MSMVYQIALIVLMAIIALLIAWMSIIIVIKSNLLKHIDEKTFRLFGAFAIASIALLILGVNLPPWVPLILTLGGIAIGLARGRSRHKKSQRLNFYPP